MAIRPVAGLGVAAATKAELLPTASLGVGQLSLFTTVILKCDREAGAASDGCSALVSHVIGEKISTIGNELIIKLHHH